MTDFATTLLQWYNINKRELPWRQTNDAYMVWLSEVIMQQTQVVQGTSYYNKFICNYPDVQLLADASEDEVLKMWQGLGYYSRARNLHAAAKQIMNEFKGVFPCQYSDILSLKGVGEYTASAIASICFNLPHAVVDGNVYRFLSRYFGIATPIDSAAGKKEFAMLAHELLNTDCPGDHNQAMMEMGAVICRPAKPLCNECVFMKSCKAYQSSTVLEFPVKAKKVKQRTRYFNYLFMVDNESLLIEKRTQKDVWFNLYQLPLIETETRVSKRSLSSLLNANLVLVDEKKHVLSHQIINARFYATDKSAISSIDCQLIAVPLEELHKYAFSQLIVNFLNENTALNVE